MKMRYAAILLMAMAVGLFADVVPRLRYTVDVSNLQPHDEDVRRAETVIFERTFQDENGAAVILSNVTGVLMRYWSTTPGAAVYVVTGGVYNAATGIVQVRFAAADYPSWRLGNYEVAVLETTNTMCRGYGALRILPSSSGQPPATNNPTVYTLLNWALVSQSNVGDSGFVTNAGDTLTGQWVMSNKAWVANTAGGGGTTIPLASDTIGQNFDETNRWFADSELTNWMAVTNVQGWVATNILVASDADVIINSDTRRQYLLPNEPQLAAYNNTLGLGGIRSPLFPYGIASVRFSTMNIGGTEAAAYWRLHTSTSSNSGWTLRRIWTNTYVSTTIYTNAMTLNTADTYFQISMSNQTADVAAVFDTIVVTTTSETYNISVRSLVPTGAVNMAGQILSNAVYRGDGAGLTNITNAANADKLGGIAAANYPTNAGASGTGIYGQSNKTWVAIPSSGGATFTTNNSLGGNTISNGSFAGNGSGLTNLPSSGGVDTNAPNNWLAYNGFISNSWTNATYNGTLKKTGGSANIGITHTDYADSSMTAWTLLGYGAGAGAVGNIGACIGYGAGLSGGGDGCVDIGYISGSGGAGGNYHINVGSQAGVTEAGYYKAPYSVASGYNALYYGRGISNTVAYGPWAGYYAHGMSNGYFGAWDAVADNRQYSRAFTLGPNVRPHGSNTVAIGLPDATTFIDGSLVVSNGFMMYRWYANTTNWLMETNIPGASYSYTLYCTNGVITTNTSEYAP